MLGFWILCFSENLFLYRCGGNIYIQPFPFPLGQSYSLDKEKNWNDNLCWLNYSLFDYPPVIQRVQYNIWLVRSTFSLVVSISRLYFVQLFLHSLQFLQNPILHKRHQYIKTDIIFYRERVQLLKIYGEKVIFKNR